MMIKPIKTEENYDEALQEIEQLMHAAPNTEHGDRLDVLVTLVEVYEANHHPISLPDPIEAIIHQMESQELSRKDLEPLIGSRARVSEILNKKRSLTLKMIRNLQKGLGISAETLVKPYRLHNA